MKLGKKNLHCSPVFVRYDHFHANWFSNWSKRSLEEEIIINLFIFLKVFKRLINISKRLVPDKMLIRHDDFFITTIIVFTIRDFCLYCGWKWNEIGNKSIDKNAGHKWLNVERKKNHSSTNTSKDNNNKWTNIKST